MLARTLLAFLLLAAAPATAQDAATATVTLAGTAIEPATLTRASLAGLPRTELDVSFHTSKGEERGRYGGVLLWTLLERAGIGRSTGHHDELRRSILVTGRDGYAILFSAGEIAPEFGAKPIILATDKDGAPLSARDGLRVIVPGDKRGARSVRDVAMIEVR
ncbi:molybdopterin-dependent oxidoreductase [Aureimonas leprariae]|nr:molybdopterin-dependent oxidoreductase [Aureimonas leprariae]